MHSRFLYIRIKDLVAMFPDNTLNIGKINKNSRSILIGVQGKILLTHKLIVENNNDLAVFIIENGKGRDRPGLHLQILIKPLFGTEGQPGRPYFLSYLFQIGFFIHRCHHKIMLVTLGIAQEKIFADLIALPQIFFLGSNVIS